MILIAAIAVGAIAAFVLVNYVGGIEDRAHEGAERVNVLVVRADIPQGTPGEEAVAENLIVEDEIARDFLPATRITDLDQISGKVSLSNLAANQVLVDGMFVDPTTSQVGFGQRLEDNQVAISVSIDEVRGVAGLLVPGDLVNVFVTIDDSETVEGETSQVALEGGVAGENARLLYHQARILAIGREAAPQPGENTAEGEEAPAPSGVITFVLPVDAAQLVASVAPGNVYLALTGPDYSAQPVPRIDVSELDELPGETNGRNRFGELTPYGPDGPE